MVDQLTPSAVVHFGDTLMQAGKKLGICSVNDWIREKGFQSSPDLKK
jgi:hypothetical protein